MLTLLSREPYWPPPAVEVCISQYQPCCFPLPWNTNGKFNNTTIIIVLLLLYRIILSCNVSLVVSSTLEYEQQIQRYIYHYCMHYFCTFFQ